MADHIAMFASIAVMLLIGGYFSRIASIKENGFFGWFMTFIFCMFSYGFLCALGTFVVVEIILGIFGWMI